MLRRRFSRLCLTTPTTPIASASASAALRSHDPLLTRPRPAVDRTRFAIQVASYASPAFPAGFPASQDIARRDDHGFDAPSEAGPLECLLLAIQKRDATAALPLFIIWVNTFVSPDEQVAAQALAELHRLPAPTLSEILRWVDPVRNSEAQDLAHGLSLGKSHPQFIDLEDTIDEFGVRLHARALVTAVRTLRSARLDSGGQLLMKDYEVFIRCAGAASDPFAAIEFFGNIAGDGLAAKRSTATWTEFLKARFITEPQYYQYDPTRVIVMARQTYYERNHNITPPIMRRLDRMRLSMNHLLQRPYNRRPDRLTDDLRMGLRHRGRSPKSAADHWLRSHLYGVLINEELLCTMLISLARSSSWALMRGVVFRRGFGIRVGECTERGTLQLACFKDGFREGNPREPTEKFILATVEALGSMSRIKGALQLIQFISTTYQIDIPHKAWTQLFSWAYLCSSKPYSRGRNIQGRYLANSVTTTDIVRIWDTMTSEPYNVQPSFDEFCTYTKVKILRENYTTAVELIRNELVPRYRDLEAEHHAAVLDDVMKAATQPSQRRQQLELRKKHAWLSIARCFRHLLKKIGDQLRMRQGARTTILIPNLIAEFGDFFHDQITYRTYQGRVKLKRLDVQERDYRWELEERVTLPQKLSGPLVRRRLERRGGTIDDEDFTWPIHRQIKVRDWRRRPHKRSRAVGVAPMEDSKEAHIWWKQLQNDLEM